MKDLREVAKEIVELVDKSSGFRRPAEPQIVDDVTDILTNAIEEAFTVWKNEEEERFWRSS